MVVYSILILLIVYTYQFKNMHKYWKDGAGISEDLYVSDLSIFGYFSRTLFWFQSLISNYFIFNCFYLEWLQEPQGVKFFNVSISFLYSIRAGFPAHSNSTVLGHSFIFFIAMYIVARCTPSYLHIVRKIPHCTYI